MEFSAKKIEFNKLVISGKDNAVSIKFYYDDEFVAEMTQANVDFSRGDTLTITGLDSIKLRAKK